MVVVAAAAAVVDDSTAIIHSFFFYFFLHELHSRGCLDAASFSVLTHSRHSCRSQPAVEVRASERPSVRPPSFGNPMNNTIDNITKTTTARDDFIRAALNSPVSNNDRRFVPL